LRPKATIVGAGNVGGTAALLLAMKGIADIVLIDIVEGLAKGKALDIAQAMPLLDVATKVTGTADWADTSGSDIVLVTSGLPRKPGMSRDDLLAANARIVSSVAAEIAAHSPDSVVVVVSNPLDAMAQLTYEVTAFDRSRVLGMAGVLDTARFRHFAANALGASGKDVEALVLGSHGDLMVPLPRLARVGGVPLGDLAQPDVVESLVARTANGGIEIVELLGTGSAFVAPAASAVAMVQAVLTDSRRVLPCSVLLEGEYGLRGVFLGVPARLGAGGLLEIVDIELTDDESDALGRSAETVAELVDRMHQLHER
jgi:malate dehydrogenase